MAVQDSLVVKFRTRALAYTLACLLCCSLADNCQLYQDTAKCESDSACIYDWATGDCRGIKCSDQGLATCTAGILISCCKLSLDWSPIACAANGCQFDKAAFLCHAIGDSPACENYWGLNDCPATRCVWLDMLQYCHTNDGSDPPCDRYYTQTDCPSRCAWFQGQFFGTCLPEDAPRPCDLFTNSQCPLPRCTNSSGFCLEDVLFMPKTTRKDGWFGLIGRYPTMLTKPIVS